MSPLFMWTLLTTATRSVDRPHIVFIVADDLGWNDVGWNNPSMKTPNLNALAREGVILSSHYVQPLCTPSRAAALTGYYPFRVGLQHGVIKKNKPRGLPTNYTLLPQKLQKLGYTTHIVGKWHLGFCKWEYTPTYRGFDSFYGFYGGHIDYYTHKSGREKGLDFRQNKKVIRKRGKYSTKLFTDKAIRLIHHHNPKKPMFLYLPFQAPHTPLQAPTKYIRKYSHIKHDSKRRLYSALVTSLDDAVGEIVEALMRKGMIQDTLIIFISDNGATPFSGGNNWPLRGGKSTLWEGGTRVPAFVWGSMLNRTRYVNDQLMHVTDWFPTILEAAGGDPYSIPDIDGVSQWDTISENIPTKRDEVIYGINDVTGKAAIRSGKYKLIEGSPGVTNDWYPLSFHRGKRPAKDTSLRHMNQTMLFNIEDDPIESNDLSKKLPHIVHDLRKRLDKHRKNVAPALKSKKVRKAHPKFWGGVWSPGWC